MASIISGEEAEINGYIIEKKLGEGAYGKTYLCIKNNKKYVLKKTASLNSYGNGKEKDISDHIKEKNSYENLFYYIEIFDYNGNKYFVSEYIGYSLSEYLYLNHHKCWEIEEIINFANQMIHSLYLFHSDFIYHRDIKPGNICIKQENEKSQKIYKIIDYGSGIIQQKSEEKKITINKTEYKDQQFGTSMYLHPKINEVIFSVKEEAEFYNENIDIWSLGLICLELFTGEQLFKYETNNWQNNQKLAKEEEYLIPFDKKKTTVEFVQFIDSMLQYEYDFQLKIEELKKLDFLNNDSKKFKIFPIEIAKKKGKYKIEDDKEYLILNFRKDLNFNYDQLLKEKEKKVSKEELIKEIFIELNEEELFTEPVLIPLIKTEDNLNNENNK